MTETKGVIAGIRVFAFWLVEVEVIAWINENSSSCITNSNVEKDINPHT